MTEGDSPANGKDEPADSGSKVKNVFLKVWKIAKDQTAKGLKSLFEKVIKKPLDLVFKRSGKKEMKSKQGGGQRERTADAGKQMP